MNKSKLTYLLPVPLFSAIICVASAISIPTPIPFTLQTLGIFLALLILGSGRGFAATLLYIAIGAVGLPVFSGFSGGLGHIAGISGGFILGFIPLCLAYTALRLILGDGGIFKRWLIAALSLIPLYAFGILYHCVFFTDGAPGARLLTVALYNLPLILPDFIKAFVAALISARLKRFTKKR